MYLSGSLLLHGGCIDAFSFCLVASSSDLLHASAVLFGQQRH